MCAILDSPMSRDCVKESGEMRNSRLIHIMLMVWTMNRLGWVGAGFLGLIQTLILQLPCCTCFCGRGKKRKSIRSSCKAPSGLGNEFCCETRTLNCHDAFVSNCIYEATKKHNMSPFTSVTEMWRTCFWCRMNHYIGFL